MNKHEIGYLLVFFGMAKSTKKFGDKNANLSFGESYTGFLPICVQEPDSKSISGCY